ncbi:MAG: ERF family protein [Hyphomicrobiaceae bacterium]
MRTHGPVVATVPVRIASAIAAVKAGISRVARDGRNDFDKYDYASTDAIYDNVRAAMAEHNLVIICLEAEPTEIKPVKTTDKVGRDVTRQWGRFLFQFVLVCGEDTWTDARASRSLFIEISRPTAFMAAQSYAEKSFLRSLFKIPTGDKDLEQIDDDRSAKPRSQASFKKDGAEWQQFERDVADCDDLTTLMNLQSDAFRVFPKRWQTTIAEVVDTRKVNLVNGFMS